MKKILKIIFILLFMSTLSAGGFVFGQEEKLNGEIKNINKNIQKNKERIKQIEEQKKYYSDIIQKVQSEKASLNNQLAILDNRLAKAELDIESTEIEIEKVDLEIRKTNIAIDSKNKEIETEKNNIESALRLMHKQDEISALEIILLNNSFADFVSQVKYLEDISEEIKNKLDNIKEYKKQLEEEKEKLNKKNESLAVLKNTLDEERKQLEEEMGNRSFILEQTKSSEKEYQRLLAGAKEEQRAAEADIASLEQAARSKVSSLSGDKLEFNDSGFIWPVPKNTITSLFHDPDYPFRRIFEHPAVDIRVGQGTPLKATASGYVARAKNAGKGYSYIMLIHGDGLSTVYGHVSKIYVEEDEYVVQGQVIGLSGGMPGTPGAGSLTTGAHLHFEVRSGGIPVNPLEYLP